MPLFLVASFVLLNDVYLNAIPCATEAEEEEVGVDSATEMTLGRWMFGFLAASLCDDPPFLGVPCYPICWSLKPFTRPSGHTSTTKGCCPMAATCAWMVRHALETGRRPRGASTPKSRWALRAQGGLPKPDDPLLVVEHPMSITNHTDAF